MGLVPDDVVTIAVIVSIDLQAQPSAVFDQYHFWQADITQPSEAQLPFAPGPFSSSETVAIAVELYRHTPG
ncbi:hypothetical protein ACFVHS_46320 [Streptomyces sp. NPDC057746]|uniref:hypothetical protein n=1 Tax=Streptomyces sp. NPDC057746 TaxID=3346237 RepID=UPI0036CF139B